MASIDNYNLANTPQFRQRVSSILRKSALAVVMVLIINLCSYSQIEKDKVLHFGAGALLAEVGYIPMYLGEFDLYQGSWLAGSAVLVGGASKEMFDAFSGGRFNMKDYGATCLGGAITIGLNVGVYKLREHIKKKKNRKKADPYDVYLLKKNKID